MAVFTEEEAQNIVDKYPIYIKDDEGIFQCFFLIFVKDGFMYDLEETDVNNLVADADLSTVKAHFKTLLELKDNLGVFSESVVDTDMK